MATNDPRYFRHMGNRSHSAWFSVRKVNLRRVFGFDRLDSVFVADFSVDEVLCCSCLIHNVDSDSLLFAMLLYLDHNMVIVVFEAFRVVECRIVVLHDDGFSFVPQTISY